MRRKNREEPKPRRDAGGRWVAGQSGNPSGRRRTIPISGQLAQTVAAGADVGRIARKLISRAYDGDDKALATVCDLLVRAGERQAPESEASESERRREKLKRLSVTKLKVLRHLTAQAEAQDIVLSEFINDLIALLAETVNPGQSYTTSADRDRLIRFIRGEQEPTAIKPEPPTEQLPAEPQVLPEAKVPAPRLPEVAIPIARLVNDTRIDLTSGLKRPRLVWGDSEY